MHDGVLPLLVERVGVFAFFVRARGVSVDDLELDHDEDGSAEQGAVPDVDEVVDADREVDDKVDDPVRVARERVVLGVQLDVLPSLLYRKVNSQQTL